MEHSVAIFYLALQVSIISLRESLESSTKYTPCQRGFSLVKPSIYESHYLCHMHWLISTWVNVVKWRPLHLKMFVLPRPFELEKSLFSKVLSVQKVKAVARKNISRFIALDKIEGHKKSFSPFFRDYSYYMGQETHLRVFRVWVDLTKPLFTLFDQSMFAEYF